MGSTIDSIITITLIFVFLIPFMLCAYDAIFKTSHSCTYFGWHRGDPTTQVQRGINSCASCSKCGKAVMQDSQGNWFTSSEK